MKWINTDDSNAEQQLIQNIEFEFNTETQYDANIVLIGKASYPFQKSL